MVDVWRHRQRISRQRTRDDALGGGAERALVTSRTERRTPSIDASSPAPHTVGCFDLSFCFASEEDWELVADVVSLRLGWARSHHDLSPQNTPHYPDLRVGAAAGSDHLTHLPRRKSQRESGTRRSQRTKTRRPGEEAKGHKGGHKGRVDSDEPGPVVWMGEYGE
jgi:hypothetical protein